MSRFSLWLLVFILFTFGGVRAEAQTELRLTATGTVQLPPDEAVADLTVQVYAPLPRLLVNRLTAAAALPAHQPAPRSATVGWQFHRAGTGAPRSDAATGTVELPPDQAIADLTVQVYAPQAAAAQASVNG